ncbi:nucleotidyltransferase domain-containing protein [Candidatus Woesearchaeota archaeon]|nr:nucleotidyltransferase domain-containing protein [Candidatus Woesearchaeota archaeon]
MQFKIEKKTPFTEPEYSPEDYKSAQKFADALKRELGTEFLKAVVLFGSTARAETKTVQEHDIDVLLIINDLTIVLNPEVISAYRVIVEKTASGINKRLHITTLKLTNFWDYLRNGDPLAINMLRDGVVLHDTGFFMPAQALLYQGRIRPTTESIWGYFVRAPATLNNSEWHVLQAALDLYWAVIDAAHAALMKVGEVPPTPAHVAGLIEKKLSAKGLAPKRAAQIMEFFYNLSKQITHRQLTKINGKDYDNYKKEAEQFIEQMRKIVEEKV